MILRLIVLWHLKQMLMIMRPMFKKYNTFGKENEVDRINSKIKRLELTRPKTNYLITNYKLQSSNTSYDQKITDKQRAKI